MACRKLFEVLEPYKLAHSKLHFTSEVLGHGSYATVLKLNYMGLKCAGKKIHEVLVMEENTTYTVQRFQEECKLLSQIRHPNVVQFLGVCFQDGEAKVPILVMEYLALNLTNCIEKYKMLPNEISYSILHDVALGLYYLHSHSPDPIIHRDLSSNNILLTTHMTAKISDLGMARLANTSHEKAKEMTITPGTPIFMPPETMLQNPVYDVGVDRFSYGIVMLHVLSGMWPEPHTQPICTIGNILEPVSEAARRDHLIQKIGRDHPLMELILKCIDNDPKERASAKDMVEKVAEMIPVSIDNQLEMLKCLEDNEKQKNVSKRSKQDKVLVAEEVKRELQSCKRTVEERMKESLEINGLQERVTNLRKGNDNICAENSDLDLKVRKYNELLHNTYAILQETQQNISDFGVFNQQSETLQFHFSLTFPPPSSHSPPHHIPPTTHFPLSPPIDGNLHKKVEGNAHDHRRHLTQNYMTKIAKDSETLDIDHCDKSESAMMQVSYEQLIHVQKLGSGHTSDVWEGKLNESTSVAIKELKFGTITISEFLQQAVIMNKICHSNVLKLCAVHIKEPVCIITELMKTTLLHHLQFNAKSLEFSILINISIQIANGMAYLEKEKCIHRDLAARNVLVGESLTCKIAGFELAEIVEDDVVKADSNFKFPIKWTACETFTSYPHESSTKSDVWSFGVLFWEIITCGCLPYPGMTNAQVQEEIVKGYRMPSPSGNPDNFYTIMLKCWRENMAERPSFEALCDQLKELLTDESTSHSTNGRVHAPNCSLEVRETIIYECIIHRKKGNTSKVKNNQDCEVLFVKGNFHFEGNKQQSIMLNRKLSSSGCFEYVSAYEGQWNKTTPVLVKAYSTYNPFITCSLQHIIEMCRLQHPKITEIYAALQSGKMFYTITELMKTDLSTYLCREEHSLQLPELIGISMQVAEGMAYLEEKKCVVRNLTADNIMVGNSLMCKISNLDLAQIADGILLADPKSSIPLKWTAPEALIHCMFSTKSDVWSFGILLWEIITHGCLPYPDMTNCEVREHLHQGYRMPCPTKCPDNFYYIMRECWKEKKDERPTFVALQELLKKYFQELREQAYKTDDMQGVDSEEKEDRKSLLFDSLPEEDATKYTDTIGGTDSLQHNMKHPIYEANCNYEAQENNELSFNVNDLMEIQHKHTDWYWGKSATGEEGYIPSSSMSKLPLLSFSRKCNRSTYGSLWMGRWKETAPVTIEWREDTSSYTKDIIELHHQNKIEIYAVYAPNYIVMEPVSQGTLIEVLQNKGNVLQLPQFIDMSKQIAAGMAYLEEMNCIHRQLAAMNILVGNDLACKVSNFSAAKIVTRVYDSPKHGVYTFSENNVCIYIDQGYAKMALKWTAPEAITEKKFSSRSDVWSFGILLSEIITHGSMPYPEMTDKQVLEGVLMKGYCMPQPNNCPEKFYNIMLNCWKFELIQRPSFNLLLSQLENYYNS